jgi:hypothetical protein
VKRTFTADDLFIGNYPTGIVYANKRVEVAGDYKRLAYLNYRTLALEVDKGCPKELLALIQADHARMLALKHTLYSIAGNMQIVLGDADLTHLARLALTDALAFGAQVVTAGARHPRLFIILDKYASHG